MKNVVATLKGQSEILSTDRLTVQTRLVIELPGPCLLTKSSTHHTGTPDSDTIPVLAHPSLSATDKRDGGGQQTPGSAGARTMEKLVAVLNALPVFSLQNWSASPCPQPSGPSQLPQVPAQYQYSV